ncbi:hypothetical protein PB01_08265 [Psychrobacillus glaciei]|uniref:Uncharacterized protein n=1 Tax=Psychrobacillus glaciei TaxID=2283160 RepID=A0A5J6SRN0_9BACI|nr:hypothetical protein [Psychrobacillus glaciei]QFF98827.1 hypothetical protein PB01_08265 [Psychrobacillus glaciei]
MIDKYLVSNCLFIIDDFNERYKNVSNEELKIISNTEYSEADMVVRLGYPFRQMATFNMQGKSKEAGNDIVVKSKDFKIEVKLLRNYKSSTGVANSSVWSEIERDFSWLSEEIERGFKGKRAFVVGWFNVVERFSQIVQLGKGRGSTPDIDHRRMGFFPFLYNISEKTKDIKYKYISAYEELEVNSLYLNSGSVKCMFFGAPTDVFHIAVFW